MDTAQYLDAFISETEDNLTALNQLCLTLEQQGAEDETLAAMFRAAHTLKGMSATMGFAQMAELTHHMEDALSYIQQHREAFEDNVIDVLFQALDALANHLESIRANQTDADMDDAAITNALAEIAEASRGKPARTTDERSLAPEVLQALKDIDATGEAVVGVLEVLLSPSCAMKGVRMVMVMRAIENLGDCIGATPDAQQLEEGDFDGPVLLAIVLQQGSFAELEETIANISEVEAVRAAPWPTQAQASQAPSDDASHEHKASSKASARVASGSQNEQREQTLRVPVSRIDEFMNVLSELVIAKTRLELAAHQAEDPMLLQVSEQIARLSDALQTGVMQMRMMPVEALFQRFPRMMRDLQKTLDREFDFEMTGLRTEMDRTVMDEMGEALVHLLRNAADHGLESPAARAQAGKARRGTIRLSAYASGSHVYLEVSDDGRGVDREKVLKKAMDKGLVSPDMASAMTDAQVYDLLFASGFSTAVEVSDISGRGVGLDAVRGKVESLGGRIRIESQSGQGSSFLIALPLTLTILQAMLVQVNADVFALPTSSIEEVTRLSGADVDFVHEQPVISYRNHIVPVIDLGQYFFGTRCQQDEEFNVVICREGKRYLALVVDDVIDELEIVNKPLGKYLASVKLFSGATILGDGHVALIVNVHHFFQYRA